MAPRRTMAHALCVTVLLAVALAPSQAQSELPGPTATDTQVKKGPVFVRPPSPAVLGRRDIPGGSVTIASANVTLPFPLPPANSSVTVDLFEEYGDYEVFEVIEVQARRLLEQTSQVCRGRSNVHFVGGGLDGGAARVHNIKTAGACCSLCQDTPHCAAWTWSKNTRICYPKASSGWTAKRATNMVSGQLAATGSRKVTATPSPAAQPWWQPKLTIGDHALSSGFAKDVHAFGQANNKFVVKDPSGDSDAPVIKTVYNKGCWSPSEDCGGGALFYAYPQGEGASMGEEARLEYEVYFPAGFTWVKGGKLPGLIGGDTQCSGGANANNCWSVRLMWREDGYGEAYVYATDDQDPGFCTTPGTKCDYHAGHSLMRGAFRFQTGRWTKLSLKVRMNDVGKANGLIQVAVDGSVRINYDRMVFRKNKDLAIDAFFFATWFGGSDKTWAPTRDLESYWRNIKIYKP